MACWDNLQTTETPPASCQGHHLHTHWDKVTCLSSQRCLSKCNVCEFSQTPGLSVGTALVTHQGLLTHRNPQGLPTGLSAHIEVELRFLGNMQTCLHHCQPGGGTLLPRPQPWTLLLAQFTPLPPPLQSLDSKLSPPGPGTTSSRI